MTKYMDSGGLSHFMSLIKRDTAITSEADGQRSIVTENAADLPLLTLSPVVGESVQDGTPTPSAPKYISCVRGGNVVPYTEFKAGVVAPWYKNQNAVLTAYDGYLSIACGQTDSTPGAYIQIELPSAGTYNYTIDTRLTNATSNQFSLALFTTSVSKITDIRGSTTPTASWVTYSGTFTTTASGTVRLYVFTYGKTDTSSGVDIRKLSISYGSTVVGYAPYGHIGVLCSNGNSTYLDLKGNELHGLDTTYYDQLDIDASGHAALTKRTGTAGPEEFVIYSTPSDGTRCRSSRPLAEPPAANATVPIIKSNMHVSLQFSGTFVSGKVGIVPSGRTDYGGAGTLFIGMPTSVTTKQELLDNYPSLNVVYPLPESSWHTIDLGYVDLPQVTDGSTVYVAAEVQPIIGGSWWTKSGEGAGKAVDALDKHTGLSQCPYTEVEWVESNGKQYVYLDWKPPIATWGFEADFIVRNAFNTTQAAWRSDTNASNAGSIFGTRNSSGVNDIEFTTYNTTGLLRNGNGSYNTSGLFKTDKTRQTVSYRGTSLKRGDGTTVTWARTSETADKAYANMALFCYHEGVRRSGAGNLLYPSTTRIYSLKFYDGNTLKVDLVGAIRNRDGMTGLYDKVKGHFYPAANMTYGNSVGMLGTPDDLETAVAKKNPIVYVDNRTNSRMWRAAVPALDKLEDGQQITVIFSTNIGASYQTTELAGWDDTGNNSYVYLKLTLTDGIETDWIPCWYSRSGRLTSHCGSSVPLLLTYRENVFYDQTTTSAGASIMRGWYCVYDYNSDNQYDRYSSTVIAGLNGLKRYTVCMKDTAGNWTSITTTANSSASTGKAAYTGALMLGKALYMSSGAEYAAGANGGDMWQTYPIDLRYSFNGFVNSASTQLQLRKPFYIVGTVDSDDGYFYLDTTQWWTQTPNDTTKVYLLLGHAYNSYYQIYLAAHNPAYIYDGSKLVEYHVGKFEGSLDGNATTATSATTASALTYNPAGRPSSMNNNYHDSKLRYYIASGATSTGKPPTDANVLHLAWDNSGWDRQLALGCNSSDNLKPKAYIRTENGSGTWGDWQTVYTTAETVAVANGGTGQTTAQAAANALIGALDNSAAQNTDYTDNTSIITTNTSGTTGTYYHRKASLLWNYIKGKIGSVLGLTADNGAYQQAQAAIAVQTGSTKQSHITLQTLMTWLITTKQYIPSGKECRVELHISWSYADNDILQFTASGVNYELQLAGCIIVFEGNATAYNAGRFRLKIYSSPANSFTVASGYNKVPLNSIAVYSCNGSTYSPAWNLLVDTSNLTAGTGLSKTGFTLNHSNSVTAGTAGTSSATSGTNTLAVPYVTYDAQGHVTASGTHTHTIGNASTSAYGVTQLSSATDSTSEALAATPKAVSSALAAAKTYADGAGVTGVKGNSESSYRAGKVNLTPANIGAVALSGNETVAGNKTFSGTTALTPDSVFSKTTNTVISKNQSSLIQSPIPKYLWHDLFSFNRYAKPTYYTSTNNTTWTEATLDSKVFAQLENIVVTGLTSTISGVRWQWYSTSFNYCSAAWLVVGICTTGNTGNYTICLETSSDGSTWTKLHESTNNKFETPLWCYAPFSGVMPYVRLTITKDPSTATTVNFSAIKLLTSRWGNQGGGSELEYPYIWDEVPNITPLANNASDLGSSSKKWNNIYASDFRGNRFFGGLIAPTQRWTSANITDYSAVLKYALATSSMTTGKPTGGDGHLLSMEWDNNGKWAAQLSVPTSDTAHVQWRTQGGTDWAKSWHSLLDEKDLSSATDSTAENLAATPKAVSSALAAAKTYADGKNNQNAFSNVKVGSTTVAADTTTDTLELAGSNVTLTPDATNDKVTIGITASNVTSALGNTAVARATADASGNTITSTYVKKSGDTMTGALNFANNTYNAVGDDVYMGDINQAGKLGVKGKNGATGIVLVPYSGSTSNTISNDGAGNLTISGTTNGTFSGSLTGNASSATKLATARTINVSGGVSGTATSFDGSANISIPVNSLYTNYLAEPSIVKSGTKTSLPLVETLKGNKLALLPADQIIIEKTTDGGATWVDYGATDEQKRLLFVGTTTGSNITVPLLNNVKNVNCGVRITFTAMKYNVPAGTAETGKYAYWNSSYVKSQERYCTLQAFYFWVGTNSDGLSCKCEKANGNASTTWITVFNKDTTEALTGWSGGDYIAFTDQVFGGGTTQTGQAWNWRLTFFTRNGSGGTTLSTSNTGSAQQINRILGYGANGWGVPNNLFGIGHLYTWDTDANAIFPKNITANAGYLKSTLNGNTVQIGSSNAGYCHITNSLDIPFWFNNHITLENGKGIGRNSGYGPSSIDMTPASNSVNHGGYIDFHYNKSTEDYTTRIIEDENGRLSVYGDLRIGANTQAYIDDAGIRVNDVRNATIATNSIANAANFYFTNSGTPNSYWWSLFHVKGWTGSYNAWEIAGPAHDGDQRTTPLYVRSSSGSTWGSWRQVFDSAATIPVANGGTGQTTANAAANAFMNALDTGSSDPVDNDYYISQYVNGGTTTTTYHRRPLSKLWNYMKSKISSWMKNNTAKGTLGWTSSANDTMPITSNTLAYWDGSYTGNSSNLTYCVKGAFGTMATKNSLAATDIPAHASTATTYGAASTSNYGHAKLSSATNSSSEDLAATPKAVKAAYDLANTANTAAGNAMSAATGALYFKITYSISNGNVVGAAHVYSAGNEVTSQHNDSCFVWSYCVGTGSWVSLGTGKTKTVTTVSSLGFGGNLKCDFTPATTS